MKKLFWYQVENEDIVIKDEDREVVLEHFKNDIQLFYDEYNRVYNEAMQYIADIVEINN